MTQENTTIVWPTAEFDVKTLASQLGLPVPTARAAIKTALASNTVKLVRKQGGKRGKPTNIYSVTNVTV